MNILYETVRLITQPPGNLVYFLVSLFALQQALFTITAVQQRESAWVKRWTWAVAGMLTGRLVLIVLGLLSNVNIISASIIMPPTERFFGFLSVILAIWAMLSPRDEQWQTWVVRGLAILALGFYVYSLYTWPALSAANYAYNGTFQEITWEAATTLAFLLGLTALIIIRPAEWEWSIITLAFWLGGSIAQLLWPDMQSHISGWDRLAIMAAYPLLTILVSHQLQNGTAATPPRLKETVTLPDLKLLENTMQGVEASRDVEPALIIASSRLAQLLDAEICAVALAEEDKPDYVRIVAVHPPMTAQIETPELSLDAYATLKEAWETQKAQTIQSPFNPPWLQGLYARLGSKESGPLLVLPLSQREERLGLLLLGNLDKRKRWGTNQQETHQLVAMLLATSIARAKKQASVKPILSQMRGQGESQQQLEMALNTAKEESKTLSGRINVLVSEIKNRDRQLLKLQAQLDQAQAQQNPDIEVNFWQNEVRELAHDRDMLITERNRLAEELADAKAQIDDMQEAQSAFKKHYNKMQHELDITRQAQKEALSEIEQKTSANMTVGLLIVDKDGDIRMADALVRQMMRVPSGDLDGMPADGLYPDPHWAKTIAELLSPDPQSRRRAHLTLTEPDKVIEADLVTLAGRDGKPDGLAITLHTEENPAERQEAIAGLASEFRTPMTALTGYTDLLLAEQAGILTEMQQQFLERVKANVEQMGHLLNELITFTSPETRPLEISAEPVDLIAIIKDAVQGLTARFRERRLSVKLDLPPDSANVRADRDALYQIMLRLLSNAALCSVEGSVVKVAAQQEHPEGNGDQRYLRISVIDTGGGIAPADMPRVFRRFYRAGQTLVQGMGETGVGMAVAKALVEANGGRIWVETEPKVGSTFCFVLPIANEHKK
ncbi:MAG: GAF domain-containing protein [Anaerolineae bacterium]|nr:GAF domain-containing protein [Anaerolineae bacterium]